MRLTSEQIQAIRTGVAQVAGQGRRSGCSGLVFMIKRVAEMLTCCWSSMPLSMNRRNLPARLSVRISRAMHGRKVDVLVKAPNLMHMPIHTIAMQEGIRL